jgi:hypothetical protein
MQIKKGTTLPDCALALVPDSGLAGDPKLPASPPKANAIVGVFPIHEIPVIKKSDTLYSRSS